MSAPDAPDAASRPNPSLTLIIPAFNEEARLPKTLDAIALWLQSPHSPPEVEILIVDDGSRDRTSDVARAHPLASPTSHGPSRTLRVIRLNVNRGKGAAIRTAVAQATCDHILFCDADLATPIECYADIRRALDAGADIAIGSRALAESRIEVPRPPHRQLMSYAVNSLSRLLTGLVATDVLCGFKGFQRHAAQALFAELRAERYAFDVEVLAMARMAGLHIVEVPITWRHDARSTVQPLTHSVESLVELIGIALRVRKRQYLEDRDSRPSR